MSSANPERVLIHAPYGRDGEIFLQVLSRAGITSSICVSVQELCRELPEGAGTVIIADEALSTASVNELSSVLSSQETWSDLPVFVLTGNGEATELSRYRTLLRKPLGNLNLLERPLRTETVISAVEAALRARRRQYEVRELLKSLQEANTELQNTNRELEEFAYAASHDLREPLRMINIYTELMTRRISPPHDRELDKYAEVVHKSVERMELLLQDLLRFAHVIHEERPAHRAASLGDALAESITVLQPRIEETGAEITTEQLPNTSGDQSQFSLVFTNLLSNALKYRKTGQNPKIRIAAEHSGEEWVVKVKDDGIGFDQMHAERVFGLFKRLHRDDYPGTGVGLAICKRIVERHGGRIWAESAVDRGSTFYFTVPESKTT